MVTIYDLSWWYWFLTVGLLGAGLLGWPAGIFLAMVLCAVMIVHVVWLTRDDTAFPVQVRIVYLAMLIAGLWGPLQWIHWMLAGRNHGAGAIRLLPAGENPVAGAMESPTAVVVSIRPANVPLAPGRGASVR